MAQNTISWGWWRQVNTPIGRFCRRECGAHSYGDNRLNSAWNDERVDQHERKPRRPRRCLPQPVLYRREGCVPLLAPALILYDAPQLWLFLGSGDGCDRAFGFRKQAQIELLYRFER